MNPRLVCTKMLADIDGTSSCEKHDDAEYAIILSACSGNSVVWVHDKHQLSTYRPSMYGPYCDS